MENIQSPSTNVIYDDLSAFSSASYVDPTPGVFPLPAPNEDCFEVYETEKIIEPNDIQQPKNNSVLPGSIIQENKALKQEKQPSPVQGKEHRERSLSPKNSSKKKLLDAEREFSTKRGRSLSPRKVDSKISKEHSDRLQGSKQTDSKRTQKETRERSVSPRKSYSKNLEGAIDSVTHAKDSSRRQRGRSASPTKAYKREEQERSGTGREEKLQKQENKSPKHNIKVEGVDHSRERKDKASIREDKEESLKRHERPGRSRTDEKEEKTRKEGERPVKQERDERERGDKNRKGERVEKHRREDREEKHWKDDREEKHRKDDREERHRRVDREEKPRKHDKSRNVDKEEQFSKETHELLSSKKTDDRHEKSRREEGASFGVHDKKSLEQVSKNNEGRFARNMKESEKKKQEIDHNKKGHASTVKKEIEDPGFFVKQAEKDRYGELSTLHEPQTKNPTADTSEKTKDEGVLRTGGKKAHITPGPWKVPGTNNANTLDI